MFGISSVCILGLSQFNAVRALVGEPACRLAEDQYLVNNSLAYCETIAGLMREQAAPLTIAGVRLTCAPDKLAQEVRTGATADVGRLRVTAVECQTGTMGDAHRPGRAQGGVAFRSGGAPWRRETPVV